MGILDLAKIVLGVKSDKGKTEPVTDFAFPIMTDGSVIYNRDTAMTISAVFNAMDIISNDIAILPKKVYQKTDTGRQSLPSHPVNFFIHNEPNNKMTSFMFHKALVLSAIRKGNGLAIIKRNNLADIISLELVTTDAFVYRYNDEIYYEIDNVMYHSADIIHIAGFSFNGITGKSVFEYAAESMGTTLNAQRFSKEYYNGKAQGIGIVETDKFIDKDQKQKIEGAVSASLNSASRWRVPVLDDGMKFKQIKLTAEEVKFLETFKFSVEEIARWFNLSVVKLKSLDNASYNNVENLELMHSKDSILPWVVKFEQEYTRKLLSDDEKRKQHIYIKFNMNVLQRADMKSRAEYYSKMVFNGLMTPNEIRALEEMNAVEGADTLMTPVNTQPADQLKLKMEKTQAEIDKLHSEAQKNKVNGK